MVRLRVDVHTDTGMVCPSLVCRGTVMLNMKITRSLLSQSSSQRLFMMPDTLESKSSSQAMSQVKNISLKRSTPIEDKENVNATCGNSQHDVLRWLALSCNVLLQVHTKRE